ncbi:MAG: DNA alkylation response protein, partial [Candidatus Microthrix sp.]|nr:DNA alkylation response protein [Candidatus Microthrix sp.]
MATHDVTNQSRPLVDYDVFGADPALTEALQREGAGWAGPDLERIGRLAGSEGAQEWGRAANANPPE